MKTRRWQNLDRLPTAAGGLATPTAWDAVTGRPIGYVVNYDAPIADVEVWITRRPTGGWTVETGSGFDAYRDLADALADY